MNVPMIGRPPGHAAVPAPAARLPLRDELYLLGHDMDTGVARVHTGSLAAGLAGAVLIDLVLFGDVTITDGRIANEYRDARGDLIADAVMAGIRTGPRLPPVGVWLRGCAEAGLYERVRGNLLAVGILRQQPRRVRADLYVPVDMVWSVRARAQIRSVLHGYEQPDPQCAALCGLIDALGLQEYLYLDDRRSHVRRGLRIIAARHDPCVQHITAAVADVVGDLAMAVYR